MDKELAAFLLLDRPILRNVVQATSQLTVFPDEEYDDVQESTSKQFRQQIIPVMDDEEFKSHFRMSRETFTSLLSTVGKHLPVPYGGFGKNVIPPEERLYIGIWFFTSCEGYRQLSTRFGTTESTIHESVDMVLNALSKEFSNTAQFPTKNEECEKLASKFKQKNGYPGVIGVIAGTHINVRKPDTQANRKGIHSMNFTAVVDSDRRFLHFNFGCPGSFHDQEAYRLTKLQEILDVLPDNYHILGDSSYSLSTHLIVPYEDNQLTVQQQVFNLNHASILIVAEQTLGILKMRFPRIHVILNASSWDRQVSMISACIYLHNFIETHENTPSDVVVSDPVALPIEKNARRDHMAARS